RSSESVGWLLHFVRNDPRVKPKGRLQNVCALPSLRGHAVAAVIQALPLIALWGFTKFFIHEERDQKKEMATSAFYPILP
ncbi:MAG: hypothetical protein WCG04_05100, partial [Alphaproteobacteria bacterium]